MYTANIDNSVLVQHIANVLEIFYTLGIPHTLFIRYKHVTHRLEVSCGYARHYHIVFNL